MSQSLQTEPLKRVVLLQDALDEWDGSNPYWLVTLEDGTRAVFRSEDEPWGSEAEVAAYVFEDDRAAALVDRLEGLLGFLLPLYDEEGKAYLTVAVGCTGGRHRSVAVLVELARRVEAGGREVSVEHRDVEKAT